MSAPRSVRKAPRRGPPRSTPRASPRPEPRFGPDRGARTSPRADDKPAKPVGKAAPRAPKTPKKRAVPAPLTGKQRRFLRGLAHHLEPLVQIGKGGLTDGVVDAIDEALERHELVKVRLGTECPDGRDEVAEQVAPRLGASLAQTIGRTFLLYRRHPSEPVIHLPKGE